MSGSLLIIDRIDRIEEGGGQVAGGTVQSCRGVRFMLDLLLGAPRINSLSCTMVRASETAVLCCADCSD